MAKPVEADVVLACGEHLPAVDVWMVIDVLRATTVIVRWFELGGGDLYPAASVGAARDLARKLSNEGETPLLMGEENAIPPAGFDLGNSPLDLSREAVQTHSCAVMATSNGTKALLDAAATGTPVLAACCRNALAALEHALSIGSRIGLLCAGRRRRPGWDDMLCAGLLLAELRRDHPGLVLADSARLALLAWQSAGSFQESMASADHAVFLSKIGYGADIAFACEQDVASVVPMLHEKPDGDGMIAVLRNSAGDRPNLPRLRRAAAASGATGTHRRRAPAPDKFASFLQYIEDGAQYFFLGSEGRKKDSLEKKLRMRQGYSDRSRTKD